MPRPRLNSHDHPISKPLHISVFRYGESDFEEKQITSLEEIDAIAGRSRVTWINIEGTTDTPVLEKLRARFGLHHLVIEDIQNRTQRTKVEDYGEYLYLVLKMLSIQEKTGKVQSEQMNIILAPGLVISFQEGLQGDLFNPVRGYIRKDKSRLRSQGADYLAYELMDAVVDSYFVILDHLADRIDTLEEQAVSNPSSNTLKSIHALKWEIISLRKSIWPLREVISTLGRGQFTIIKKNTELYLRVLYDHTVQAIDEIETFWDVVSGMIDIHLSALSNKMNEVMKVLTVIGTIFMPLTFLAGVYGMNFHYFPEITWKYGYLLFWVVIMALATAMMFIFKRRRWF